MGVYILFLYLGATLAPLLGGFIFNGLSWQAVLVSCHLIFHAVRKTYSARY